MKKGIKRILSKRGMSLVEILVVLFVSSILLGCAMGMLTPVNNLLNSLKVNAHLDSLCDTANEYIRGSFQNATAISVLKYDGSTTAIETKINEYETLSNNSTDYRLKVKALAILDSGDQNFRLYDLGVVTASGIGSRLSSPADDDAVFMNDYYENRSLAVTFENAAANSIDVTDSDGNVIESYASAQWLKVYSQCYSIDDSGNANVSNQIRGLSFKILGGSVRFGGNTSAIVNDDGSGIKSFDIDDLDKGIVIVYATKDFNDAV
ncbi:MAG: prepilin-type N-terminal cleavage/methylation domain-containing protein [Bacteroides sp.]|nr:prepilin-type N-terminal cleavage/methylation domain-containing protein [Bacteroides sp.]